MRAQLLRGSEAEAIAAENRCVVVRETEDQEMDDCLQSHSARTVHSSRPQGRSTAPGCLKGVQVNIGLGWQNLSLWLTT